MVSLIYSSDLRINITVAVFNTKKKKKEMGLTISESYLLITAGWIEGFAFGRSFQLHTIKEENILFILARTIFSFLDLFLK